MFFKLQSQEDRCKTNSMKTSLKLQIQVRLFPSFGTILEVIQKKQRFFVHLVFGKLLSDGPVMGNIVNSCLEL